jgi:hypothetical protein
MRDIDIINKAMEDAQAVLRDFIRYAFCPLNRFLIAA